MIWQLLQTQSVQPRFFVSGCPKHGLHLAAMLVDGVSNRNPPNIYNDNHWLGTYQFNSFAPVIKSMDRWFFIASLLRQGHYLQGHLGYRDDIATFFDQARMAHVFIYRDLRDVAVSMAHHIASDDNVKFRHAGKAAYRCAGDGGLEDILTLVIDGCGGYPGVVQLWENYAGWLDHEGTLAIRFEETVADREKAAFDILDYAMQRTTVGIWEAPFRVEKGLFDEKVAQMAESAAQTDKSPTFRKAQPGEWRETFTEHHKQRFKAQGGGQWLIELGYEQDKEW